MPFLSYSEQTGLIVKSKADIFEDLKSICKTAYGPDFAVIEGTEMYTLLDILASSLAQNGAATKAVYDAFGFMGASGAPLDVLCSLAGVTRKTGEPDNALRARYFKYLYSTSVGTAQGLEAQLLKATKEITQNNVITVQQLINDVYIENNTTSNDMDFIGTDDLRAHSIAVSCRYDDTFYTKTFDTSAQSGKTYYIKYNQQVYVPVNLSEGDTLADNIYYELIDNSGDLYIEMQNTISNIITDYKSLGCGILKDYFVATSRGSLGINVNIQTFMTTEPTYGTYVFNYTGTVWQLNGNDVDIADYGITIITGTPQINDTITVTTTDNNYFVATSLKLDLTLTMSGLNDGSEEAAAAETQILNNLKNYINLLHIGEPVTYQGIMGCVHNAYVQLGYTTSGFDCTVIQNSVDGNLITVVPGGKINVAKNRYAVCYSVTFLWS